MAATNKPAAAAAKEGKVKVKALVPIVHDGDTYEIDEEISVTEKQAAQLIEVKAAAAIVVAEEANA